MTLSVINNTIDEERQCKLCNFKNVDIICVYAFNIEIDIDPNKLSTDRKEIEFNFMHAGSKKKSLVGTKYEKRIIKVNFNKIRWNKIELRYENLKIRFIDIYKTGKIIPDPIVMRAFATCLLINLDSSYGDAPASPTETNPKLSRWYKLIKRSVTFDEKMYYRIGCIAH